MSRKSEKLVMIADDDPDIVEVLQCMISQEGYRVIKTGNQHTLEDVKKHMPDVLLLDRWMVDSDGLAICKNLKNNIQTNHISVFILSASGDIDQLAREAGADAFIEKPFDMYILLKKIAEII